MAGRSPTQSSLAALRADGYTCWVVEYWNAHTQRRVDLFGCIDILAIREGETLAVQTTSASGVSARVKKMTDNEYMPAMRAAGWSIQIQGWRMKAKVRGGKAMVWVNRVVDMS
jgi:hypothetical protein